MKRSNEAFWWSLFSAGGVMAALFLPALVLVTGLILPFLSGQDAHAQYERMYETVSFWLIRVVLFVVIFLSFFHCAHRIRHILMDLGWRSASTALSLCCYGAAGVGSVMTALLLITL